MSIFAIRRRAGRFMYNADFVSLNILNGYCLFIASYFVIRNRVAYRFNFIITFDKYTNIGCNILQQQMTF